MPLKTFFKKARLPENGFTLVEALVATAIIAIVIVGPMTLAENGLATALYGKDQITAYFLAEDAMEYVRNIRDDNLLFAIGNNGQGNGQGNNWLRGIDGCSATACAVDSLNSSVAPCSASNNNCRLSFDSLSTDIQYGAFAYGGQGVGWSLSPYTRSVLVTETVPNVEAKVIVTVSWVSGKIARSFSTTAFLYNWVPGN